MTQTAFSTTVRITSYNVCYTKLLREERKSESAEPTNAITRLLYGLKGKEIRLKLYPDAEDTVVENAVCVIQDFDGLWMRVICTTKKKSTEKLLPVSSVASIQYVDKGGKE